MDSCPLPQNLQRILGTHHNETRENKGDYYGQKKDNHNHADKEWDLVANGEMATPDQRDADRESNG